MLTRVDVALSPDLVAFGRRVRDCRRAMGVSQQAFGARVDLDQGSVSRLERGLLPGIRLRKLAPVLILVDVFAEPRQR